MEQTTNQPAGIQPPLNQASTTATVTKSKLPLISLLVLFFILLSAGGIYAWRNWSNSSSKQVACTMEAKVCPDGTSVGRTGPTCEFAPCSLVASPSAKVDETAGWKIYSNSLAGYSIKLPNAWGEWSLGSNKWTFSSDINASKSLILLGVNGKVTSTKEGYLIPPQKIDIAFTQHQTIAQWVAVGDINAKDCGQQSLTIGKSVPAIKLVCDKFKNTYLIVTGADLLRITFNADFPESTQILSTFKFTDQTDETAGWKTYKVSKYNFEVKYPPDLTVVVNGADTINADFAEPGTVIVANVLNDYAFVPEVDPCTKSTNCEGVMYVDVYSQSYQTMLKRLALPQGVQLYDIPVGDPNLKQEAVVVGGVTGTKVTGRAMGSGETMKVVLLPKSSETYSFRVVSSNANYLVQFDKFLSTVKFLDAS